MSHSNDKQSVLRHLVATIAYRGSKTLRDAPSGFATLVIADGVRTPVQILSHINDLFDWMLTMMQGNPVWRNSTPVSWNDEVSRFYATLNTLDECLKSDAPFEASAERLIQGPLADALTHVGQLAMLRRLANAPIRGENYYVADIEAGTVSLQQPPARKEFD